MSAPSFKGWMLEQFEPCELRDIAQHGADAGWSGLTYYSDTIELYERFEEDLWGMLIEDADAHGLKHPLALVASFAGAAGVESDMAFRNLIVWYAAERVALEVTDG